MNTASDQQLTRNHLAASARQNVPRPQVVLLTLDGSEAAATALGAARCIAQQLGMPLRVLHIAAQHLAATDLAQALHVDTAGATEGEEIVVRTGDPVHELLHAIEDPSTYVTVMTTHGRAIEPGRHLGHVAEGVVAATMRPILLIRPEAVASATAMLSAKRFLLPLDGSATTTRALAAVTDIVDRLGGSFDVLFIADPAKPPVTGEAAPGSLTMPYYVDQPHHEWPSWTQEVLDHLGACSSRYPLAITTRIHVGRGLTEAVALQFVADHQNDVIVLVRSSHLEAGRARVLRAVLDQTPCPVILTGATQLVAAARALGADTIVQTGAPETWAWGAIG